MEIIPKIYKAAVSDDVDLLKEALSEGESLDWVHGEEEFTPVHVACIYLSTQFLDAALAHGFDANIRDAGGFTATFHAMAMGLRKHRAIFAARQFPESKELQQISMTYL